MTDYEAAELQAAREAQTEAERDSAVDRRIAKRLRERLALAERVVEAAREGHKTEGGTRACDLCKALAAWDAKEGE